MKGRARSGELILAKDRKTFFEAEATLIRKRQLAKILPAVPFLVSPEGDLFLCVYNHKTKAVVRWTVTGVEQNKTGLAFTARKETGAER
jgi:hypothetical protein